MKEKVKEELENLRAEQEEKIKSKEEHRKQLKHEQEKLEAFKLREEQYKKEVDLAKEKIAQNKIEAEMRRNAEQNAASLQEQLHAAKLANQALEAQLEAATFQAAQKESSAGPPGQSTMQNLLSFDQQINDILVEPGFDAETFILGPAAEQEVEEVDISQLSPYHSRLNLKDKRQ